jgi:hypothetical protein
MIAVRSRKLIDISEKKRLNPEGGRPMALRGPFKTPNQNGKGYISQPAKIDRRMNEQRRKKKYFKHSLTPFLAMNVRTSDVRMLKISIKRK